MAPTTQRPAPSVPQDQITNGMPADSSTASGAGDVTVNRKKQKRRQKQAARLAAEQPVRADLRTSQGHTHNGHIPSSLNVYKQSGMQSRGLVNGESYGTQDIDDPYEPRDGEELYYSDEDGR